LSYSFVGESRKPLDYLFWISLILYTNPGGILQALGASEDASGIGPNDVIFVGLVACFILDFNKHAFIRDKVFLDILKFLCIFLAYYLIFFSFFVPQFKNYPNYNFLQTMIKVRYAIMHVALVLMIYHFYLRSYKLFLSIFLYSSIIVLILFLFTVFSGNEILPTKSRPRRFVAIDRLFMYSYGLVPILMSMGTVMLVFRFKINHRVTVIAGYILMFVAWILALYRRQILGAIILFFVASFINNYINGKKLVPVKKILSFVIYLFLTFFVVNFFFPDYIDAVVASVEEAYYVLEHGQTSTGKEDVRLGFGKEELQEKIERNYLAGTGFDINWRISEEAGYEASDYPLLAAIAMVGLSGMAVFIPVYYRFFRSIFEELKAFKASKVKPVSTEDFMLLVFITYFLADTLNYTYWFLPVSLFSHPDKYDWYFYFAMFFAARKVYHLKNEQYEAEQ
jgi:hypothetical protein